MSHARIRKIFSALLANYGVQKNIPVYFDNVVGTVTGDHLEAHLIPADTFSGTLSGDHKAFIGMFQITIVVQYNTGLLKAEQIVDELQAIFGINQMFTDTSGFAVQVVSPIKTPEGKQDGVQWRAPTRFDYRADTN